MSIDFFDVENQENGFGNKNRIDIWDADTNAVTKVGNTPDTGGDNLWQQILFDSSVIPGLKNVGRIDVYFAGSGALDNLTYSVVPVPAAVWLFGTALLGFIGLSRRTSV
ncbi:MAG: PEP-CTERM sorting domain-containing protein [Gammaproteobacteria bacterium]|nr:PEP-CTERM sorting domain-containing protein [Gammaproteobacteria bacterium]